MRSANLALKFGLELAALAAFAYWGSTLDPTAVAVIVAIAVPVIVALLWGRLAAPRAPRRLPMRTRIPFELGVFALAAVALAAAGSTVLAIVFAVIVIVNATLLTSFEQWEG